MRVVNRMAKPFGFFLVSHRQELLRRRRGVDLVAQLHDVYVCELFPHLPQTPRRLELLRGLLGTPVSEAMHLLHWLADAPEGDICEFGVAQGATSVLMADAIQEGERDLWLYDSFSGLPPPTPEDELIDDIFDLGSMDRYAGRMSSPRALVDSKLAELTFPSERLHVVEGFLNIEETRLPDKIAFAYIDFDLYQPILTALELIDERLVEKGRIMIDDYGFFSSGVEKAVKEFTSGRPRYSIHLPPAYAGHFCVLTT